LAEGTRKPGTRIVAKKGRKTKKTDRAVDPKTGKRVRSRLTLRERKVLVAITSALTGKLR